MPFSESLKLDVKRRTAFRCCLCEQFLGSVQVHHIIPEHKGGPSTFENAAPLCASCHDVYGNNPDKRKFIIQKRDWWYEVCRQRYGNPLFDPDQLGQLRTILEHNTAEISKIKSMLKTITLNSLPTSEKYQDIKRANEVLIEHMVPETADYISSAVVSASTSVLAEAQTANGTTISLLPLTVKGSSGEENND